MKRIKSKTFWDGLQMQHHKFTTCFKQAIINAWELKREKIYINVLTLSNTVIHSVRREKSEWELWAFTFFKVGTCSCYRG